MLPFGSELGLLYCDIYITKQELCLFIFKSFEVQILPRDTKSLGNYPCHDFNKSMLFAEISKW